MTASVPVSARQAATGGQLGNQVGTMPVALPARGDLAARVRRIAAITRERRRQPAAPRPRYSDRRSGCAPPGCSAGSSTASGWFTPSPPTCAAQPSRLTFAGAPVRAVIPIPASTGNVTVTFGVLSYAGRCGITVVSDPSRVFDVAVLTAALRPELGSAAR